MLFVILDSNSFTTDSSNKSSNRQVCLYMMRRQFVLLTAYVITVSIWAVRPHIAQSQVVVGRILGTGMHEPEYAGTVLPPNYASPDARDAERVFASLGKVDQLDLQSVPLAELAEYFKTRYGLQVSFDRDALSVLGFSPETRVTLAGQGTIAQLLDRMLSSLDCTWCVVGNRIEITTIEEAQGLQIVKVHDVTDLVYNQAGPYEMDFDTLIEVITSTLAPDVWAEFGGEGSISAFPRGKRGLIVISNTFRIQKQIDALLDALRRTSGLAPAPPASFRTSLESDDLRPPAAEGDEWRQRVPSNSLAPRLHE